MSSITKADGLVSSLTWGAMGFPTIAEGRVDRSSDAYRRYLAFAKSDGYTGIEEGHNLPIAVITSVIEGAEYYRGTTLPIVVAANENCLEIDVLVYEPAGGYYTYSEYGSQAIVRHRLAYEGYYEIHAVATGYDGESTSTNKTITCTKDPNVTPLTMTGYFLLGAWDAVEEAIETAQNLDQIPGEVAEAAVFLTKAAQPDSQERELLKEMYIQLSFLPLETMYDFQINNGNERARLAGKVAGELLLLKGAVKVLDALKAGKLADLAKDTRKSDWDKGAAKAVKTIDEAIEAASALAKKYGGKNIVGTKFSDFKPTQDWINWHEVNNYVEKLLKGEKIPPIEVVDVPGKGKFILDGHHRFVASQIANKPISMNIKKSGPVGMKDWSNVDWVLEGTD